MFNQKWREADPNEIRPFCIDVPHELGWDYRPVAAAWLQLMSQLGYERFGAQGGDWGSGTSREMGVLSPHRLLGIHLNSAPTLPTGDGAGLDELDTARLNTWTRHQQETSGYAVVQATRPQALAYALTDSPVGQLHGSWRSSPSGPTPAAAPSTATAS